VKSKSRKKGRIFVISGPSGSGKTTLSRLLSRSDKGLVRSVSVTTRKPRGNEVNKKDYIFISEDTFLKKIKGNELAEWAKVFGCFYGTPIKFLEGTTAAGKDVVLSIDVQGALQLKKKKPEAVFIFILPPDIKTLRRRLSLRNTDNKKAIAGRLKIARKELRYVNRYDYQIVNDSVKIALAKLKAIIIAQRCKVNN